LAGLGGQRLNELTHSYKGGFTKQNKQGFIDKMMKAGVPIIACDWGLCIHDPATSKCNKGENKPSNIYKEPFLCSSCTNFCATKEDYTFWNDLKVENQSLLKSAPKGSQTRILANERLASIRVVLDDLKKTKSEK